MSDLDLVPVGPGRDPEGLEDDGEPGGPDEPEGLELVVLRIGEDDADESAPPSSRHRRATGASEERHADDDWPPDDVAGAGATVADIEALLFVAERPISRVELRGLTRLSAEEVDARLGDLEIQLRERGIRLVTSGEQVMLGTSAESGPLIARYLGADAVRLSPAALETLAIVAYRQPVTRGVIERIRGVDCGHVVRGLLHRRLIRELGRAETPGRPILYVTTMDFMERFGLTSLDDLPPLEADIAAQLAQAEADAEAGLLGPLGTDPPDADA